MRLLSLKLKNFQQFKNYTLSFEPGITGFIGRIGSGKSTLIETATYFGLTGGTPPHVKRKDQLLSWDIPQGGVTVTFEHLGNTWELERKLHSEFCSLTMHGDDAEKISGATKVSAEMQKMLGMTSEVLYETCYVRQGNLWQIVTMTHSQRMDYFQRIANTVEAERLRNMFVKQRGLVKVMPDRSAEINALQTELDNAKVMQDSQAVSEKRLADALTELLVNHANYTARASALPEHERDRLMLALEPKLSASMDQVAALTTIAQAVQQPTPVPREQQELAARWQLWQSAEAQRASIEAEQREASGEHAVASSDLQAFMPKVQELEARNEALGTGIATSTQEQQQLHKQLDLVKAGICPTCKRPMDTSCLLELEGQLSTLAASLNTMVRERKQVAADLAKAQQWCREQTNYINTQEKRAVAAQSRLANLPLRPEGFDPEDYAARCRAYDEGVKQFNTAAQARKDLTKAQEALAHLRAEMERLRDAPVLGDAEAEKLRQYFQELEETQQNHQHAQIKYAEWRATTQQLQRRMDALRQEQQQGDNGREIIRVMDACAELLHRDQLPKIVMAGFRAELNDELQTILGRFAAEFTADLTEDFDVVVHFGKHRNKPAALSLSGGQKTLLSIAFHMAMTKLLAGSIPLMSVDEPTNHLGEQDRVQVRNVLLNLKHTIGQTTCLLVATHDQMLYPAFDRIIDVSNS